MLTAREVAAIIRLAIPGRTVDSNGLQLKIGQTGAASWEYRYRIGDKRKVVGLGPCRELSLAEARLKRDEMAALVRQGVDPQQAHQTPAAKASTTFKEAAAAYIEAHRAGWRNAKHAAQWASTLETYAYPKIGDLDPEKITVQQVLDVLRPIWSEIPETATRVRSRIELVIDSHNALHGGTAANPARWKGVLDKLLPRRSKTSKGHHAAMAYSALPDFMKRLRSERDSLSAKALELTILTACRTSEVLLAEWREFDLEARIWTIPATRMKAGKEHRVPLVPAVVAVLESLPTREGYLFPGAKPGKPLSNMAMTMCLRKLGHGDLTVHGFRSSFKDYASEEAYASNIVSEMCLAHTIGNAVEAAYRRGDLLEKRRALMNEWADYLSPKKEELATSEECLQHELVCDKEA